MSTKQPETVIDSPESPTATATANHVATTSSGMLVETFVNKKSILHAVCERAGGGFDYYTLSQDNAFWNGPVASPGSTGNIHSPIVFRGTGRLGEENRLEAIYREVAENREIASSEGEPGQLKHIYSRPITESTDYPWNENSRDARTKIADGVVGTPAICRLDIASSSLTVVAPLEAGGLGIWSRNSDSIWSREETIVTEGKFHHCAMASLGNNGVLVVAVDAFGRLWFLCRAQNKWTYKQYHAGYSGNPSLVEVNGPSYRLVVAAGGQLVYYAIDPASPLVPHEQARFGPKDTKYIRTGLIHSNAGHLEAIARTESGLLEHYRNDPVQGWIPAETTPKRPSPKEQGFWKVEYDTKIIGVHGVGLHTGEVLLIGMADDSEFEGRVRLLNPKTGEVKKIEPHGSHGEPHAFCGGHCLMADGSVLVAGGHIGHETMLLVLERDEARQEWQWKERPKFEKGRWYPTCTTLPDGKQLILSGSFEANNAVQGKINNSYEIYDPNRPSGGREVRDLGKFCVDVDQIETYPFVYVLPQRRIFVHSRYTTRFLDLGTRRWSDPIEAKSKVSRTYPFQGTSALLPLKPNDKGDYSGAKVVIMGGAGSHQWKIDTAATNTVEVMETDSLAPQWKSAQSLEQGRVMPDSVILPDGNVLVVGGSRTGIGSGEQSNRPELSVQLFHPDTMKFTGLAPMQTPRLYHVAAMLLPDARVLVSGKDKVFNTNPYKYPEHRGEVFTPPYLLSGNPRPVIKRADKIIDPGSDINIEVGEVPCEAVGSVILIRPSSATHSFNMDQRAVYLLFQCKSEKIQARVPKTNWVVPPGYYMLFVVSKSGVPSEAKFVHVPVFKGVN